LERADEALKWLEQAEELDSSRPESFIYRIEAYARIGDHDRAEAMFYQALQFEGDHAPAYANMGESLMDRRDYKRAISCFRQAASADPLYPRVYARLAAAYAEVGRHDRARQLYLRELREAPGDIDTLLDLGCLLTDMNRLAEAGEKFRRVLEIESDHPDAHFHLGELAMRQHRVKEAIASFRLALRLSPSHPEVRRRLAEISISQGELGEARKLLRRELRELASNPRQFTVTDLEELGELLLDVRLPRDASQVFQVLLERRPDDARVLHLVSLAHFRCGERSQGMEYARRAVRLDPTLLSALHNMALACVHERQWGKARYYLDQALEIDGDDHSLRRLRLTLRAHRALESLGLFTSRRRILRRRGRARAG